MAETLTPRRRVGKPRIYEYTNDGAPTWHIQTEHRAIMFADVVNLTNNTVAQQEESAWTTGFIRITGGVVANDVLRIIAINDA